MSYYFGLLYLLVYQGHFITLYQAPPIIYCILKVEHHHSYVTLMISKPNTAGFEDRIFYTIFNVNSKFFSCNKNW